jgi:hypothetical protein
MNASAVVVEETRDFTLEGGCIVCEGPLAVRVSPGACRGCCAACGWISRPILWETGTGMSILHPPLALA